MQATLLRLKQGTQRAEEKAGQAEGQECQKRLFFIELMQAVTWLMKAPGTIYMALHTHPPMHA